MRRRLLGVTVTLLCALILAGPVLAEGSFTSYMTKVRRGFDSRTWTDRNTDNTVTNIRLDTCRYYWTSTPSGIWVDLTLWRHNFIFPSENRGLNRFLCYSTDTEYWGDEPSSDYNFEVTNYGSGSQSAPDFEELNVSWLRVRY